MGSNEKSTDNNMIDKVINISNLVIGYKNPLVDLPINLSAVAGDIVCIIGRNGTGKSTFLNTLVGINRKLSGEIFVYNQNVDNVSAREKSRLISYVPSKVESIPNMRVVDLVAMGRTPYTNIFDKHSAGDEQIINEAIDKFSLRDFADRQLSELSDGERQKVMICRAIVQQTPIILLDEPTAFLDYFAKQKLMEQLHQIAKNDNKCIVFSSHDIAVSVPYCDKVWLFENRRCEEKNANDFLNSGYLDIKPEI